MNNPVYEIDKKTSKYGIALDNLTSIDLSSEFGQTILVIDTIDHLKNNFILYRQHIPLVAKFSIVSNQIFSIKI